MDYITKPTSREELRLHAKRFRKLFEIAPNGSFPVLECLEKLPDIFNGSTYSVVEDCELAPKTMAQCYLNEEGTGFVIEIKESVYEGALRGNGAFRGFICHELCHVYLFYMGFRPLFQRAFDNNKIPPYRSVEWQAKALCGEVMIPFYESEGLSQNDLVSKYEVSKAFATFRRRMSRQK